MRRAFEFRRFVLTAAIAALVLSGIGGSGAAAAASLAPPPRVTLAGAGWSGDRAEVEASLRRLPDTIAALLGARIIARDVFPCGQDGWPDDARIIDGRGDIHLCAPGAASGAPVARQVVTALLLAFDRLAGWSASPAWRRLNGWRPVVAAGFALEAENVSPDGFAGPRGRRSPSWDLATLIAAMLLDADSEDGGVGCRLLSQGAFVRGRLGLAARTCPAFESWADLAHLDAVELVLAAPSTAMVGSLFGHLFVRIVYRDDGGQIPPHLSRTVAFLADNDVPFGADPLFALKGIAGFYTASLHERPFLDSYREYVVAEGRDLRRWRLNLTEGERRALMERLWTGLAGGARYDYYFFRRNCATLMLDLLEGARPPEQTVGRPGVLAAPPASALEAWAEARTAGGEPLLTFVPEPILSFDHEARRASGRRRAIESRLLSATPSPAAAAVARALAEARAPAAEVRAGAYERLATLLADENVGGASDLREWLNDGTVIESHLSVLANLEAEARTDAARRQKLAVAVARVAEAVHRKAEAPGAPPAMGRAVREVADADRGVRMEGYERLRSLVVDPSGPDVPAGELRLLALLESELRFDVQAMKAVPGLRDDLFFVDEDKLLLDQAFLVGYADLVTVPVSTAIARPLRSLQHTKQVLYAARGLESAAPASTDGETLAVSAGASYEASLPRSGIDQLGVLFGIAGNPRPSGARSAGLILSSALYDERLGDHRRFGFPSDTSFVVGRSGVLMTVIDGRLDWSQYQARILGYRSLRIPLPESGASRWPLGWEIYADAEGDKARALASEIKLGWGVLAPLVARDELADHLVAAFGLAYEGYFPSGSPTAGHPQALALPLSIEGRAGLGSEVRHRSWIAARLRTEVIGVLLGDRSKLALETGAELQAHLPLFRRTGNAHDPAILVQGEILRTTLAFVSGGSAVTAGIGVGLELR